MAVQQVLPPLARYLRARDGDPYVIVLAVPNERRFEDDCPLLTVRLRDYNAPERLSDEGIAATAAARAILTGTKELRVLLKGHDRWGRLLAWLWADEVPVGPHLAEQGHVMEVKR